MSIKPMQIKVRPLSEKQKQQFYEDYRSFLVREQRSRQLPIDMRNRVFKGGIR